MKNARPSAANAWTERHQDVDDRSGPLEQFLEDVETYARLGVSELVVDFRSERLAETLERMDRFASLVKLT